MARAWSLKTRPQGMPQHTDFAMITVPDRALADGELRIANRWLSVDPYMRGRMNDVKSYVPPFVLGEPMQGGAIGEVVESKADGFAVGDKVQHMMGWRDEAVVPAAQVQKLPAIDVPEQAFLGQLGMPGMTAYFGLTE
ncbi:MAG: NADP-dependent oxidoreductase, partial [Sphingomonas sp.]